MRSYCISTSRELAKERNAKYNGVEYVGGGYEGKIKMRKAYVATLQICVEGFGTEEEAQNYIAELVADDDTHPNIVDWQFFRINGHDCTPKEREIDEPLRYITGEAFEGKF